MSRFYSRNTRELVPYVPGEQPKDKKFIKLNTNENPYPPSPLVMERIRNFNLEDLRLYPNSEGAVVKQAVAKYYGISKDEVFVGNGSDEVLAFIFKAFFDDTEKIGFPDITYSFYPVYSALFNVPYIRVPVRSDFSIDISQYPEDLKGIIFANPNAPTGLYIATYKIEELLKNRPNTLVIVDEAYIDFGGESCAGLISRYDNLIVVQTLSKSRSLAGLRVGFAMGCKELMDGLVRVKDSFNSYPLDRIAQIAAEAALIDTEYFNETRQRIIKTRQWTQEKLLSLGVKTTDSKANFLFVKIPGISGPEALSFLRQEGILVRNFNSPGICDWLRITIGIQEEMEELVEKIKKIIAG
ncbi:MAG TPA: histidinol-phosphate transaminase [Clostridiaceae bacterium]|jgi:histidinol-phosphate aminotransferase|nr:histidinol-phosphate transaminase [Clostridiaceae bacterium]